MKPALAWVAAGVLTWLAGSAVVVWFVYRSQRQHWPPPRSDEEDPR